MYCTASPLSPEFADISHVFGALYRVCWWCTALLYFLFSYGCTVCHLLMHCAVLYLLASADVVVPVVVAVVVVTLSRIIKSVVGQHPVTLE